MIRQSVMAMLFCALACSAAAQPATDQTIEQVIVTASRYHTGVTPNAVAHDFVGSYAMPSVLTDQISRWQVGVCPVFEGLAPQYVTVMEARFRKIAGEVNAPLKGKGCKPNLIVAVTPQPQSYLDALHAKNAEALGYHGTKTVSHSIQAWYVTGIQDNRGTVFLDKDADLVIDDCGGGCPPHIGGTNTAPLESVGGWRGRNDVASDLLYATIIVDSAATRHYRVGEIADYVAMLALSRSEDYGDCQLMPSITNLLSSCDDKLKPDQITPTDIAYLRGVYKMDPGAKLKIQQDQIAAEMAKAIPPR